jgi:predicted alpha-1,2-mannosidase
MNAERAAQPTTRRMVVAAVAVAVCLAACSASGSNARKPSPPNPAPVASLSALVNPFMGTGVGGEAVGNVNTSPAAAVPFGMMEWGPDTSPRRALGGGYSFGQTALSGFSLTHLNGPGCASLGDIPILPTVGPVTGNPENTTVRFDHSAEHAAPGRYSVALRDPHVSVDLGVTTRGGLGRLTFPASSSANVLFKVADSEVPSDRATTRIVSDHEVTGSVVSGHFCDTPGTYTLSFDAIFDHPFRRVGTFENGALRPGRRDTTGPHSGAVVSFDTRADPTVSMKVGISFVSIADARANVNAEIPGWDLGAVTRAATARWDDMLGRIRVQGGTAREQSTFYSALYRSLLHPNVSDDVNGQYAGFDGRPHVAKGYTQYANFSGWDIYRSELPLLAMIAGSETSDMMRSLLADHDQSGRLPKLPFTDVETAEMNGDSADPILATAYAFGVRGFDADAALRAMVQGATAKGTGAGWDVERQDLDEYLTQGWIEAGRRDRTSLDYSVGGSETLEYSIDDYAISQLAGALGRRDTAATFLARASNWRHLFNPATGYLAARDASGNFPAGPAFQPSPQPNIGQDGWEEGNSIQYTWSVPQDLHGLFTRMGGNAAAVAKLDAFFAALNTSRRQPRDWAGNEPALGIPWEYDYAGAPWRTQDVVREIATKLYAPTPNGEPGNDDLGAMSSWYVWAAIGLYPETPGRAELVLASPLFTGVTVQLASGRKIVIDAPNASAANRYVRELRVTGTAAPQQCVTSGDGYACPWLPASALSDGAQLTFTLSAVPDKQWAAATAAAPPSITKP